MASAATPVPQVPDNTLTFDKALNNLTTFSRHNNSNATGTPSLYGLVVINGNRLVSEQTCCAIMRLINMICTYVMDFFRALFCGCCKDTERLNQQELIRQTLIQSLSVVNQGEIPADRREEFLRTSQAFNEIMGRVRDNDVGCYMNCLYEKAGWNITNDIQQLSIRPAPAPTTNASTDTAATASSALMSPDEELDPDVPSDETPTNNGPGATTIPAPTGDADLDQALAASLLEQRGPTTSSTEDEQLRLAMAASLGTINTLLEQAQLLETNGILESGETQSLRESVANNLMSESELVQYIQLRRGEAGLSNGDVDTDLPDGELVEIDDGPATVAATVPSTTPANNPAVSTASTTVTATTQPTAAVVPSTTPANNPAVPTPPATVTAASAATTAVANAEATATVSGPTAPATNSTTNMSTVNSSAAPEHLDTAKLNQLLDDDIPDQYATLLAKQLAALQAHFSYAGDGKENLYLKEDRKLVEQKYSAQAVKAMLPRVGNFYIQEVDKNKNDPYPTIRAARRFIWETALKPALKAYREVSALQSPTIEQCSNSFTQFSDNATQESPKSPFIASYCTVMSNIYRNVVQEMAEYHFVEDREPPTGGTIAIYQRIQAMIEDASTNLAMTQDEINQLNINDPSCFSTQAHSYIILGDMPTA